MKLMNAFMWFGQDYITKALFLLVLIIVNSTERRIRDKYDKDNFLQKISIGFHIVAGIITFSLGVKASAIVYMIISFLLATRLIVMYILLPANRALSPIIKKAGIWMGATTNNSAKIHRILKRSGNLPVSLKIMAYNALGQIGDRESMKFINHPNEINFSFNEELYKSVIYAYAKIYDETAESMLRREMTNNIGSDKFKIAAEAMIKHKRNEVINCLKDCLLAPAETRLYIIKKLNEMGVNEYNQLVKGDDEDFFRMLNEPSLDRAEMIKNRNKNKYELPVDKDTLRKYDYFIKDEAGKKEFLSEIINNTGYNRNEYEREIEFILSLGDELSLNMLYMELASGDRYFAALFDSLAIINREKTADYAVIAYFSMYTNVCDIAGKIKNTGIKKYDNTIKCDKGDCFRIVNDKNIDNTIIGSIAAKNKAFNYEIDLFYYYTSDIAEKGRRIDEYFQSRNHSRLEEVLSYDFEFASDYLLDRLHALTDSEFYDIYDFYKENNDMRPDGQLLSRIINGSVFKSMDEKKFEYLKWFFENDYDNISARCLEYLGYLDDHYLYKIAGFYIKGSDTRILGEVLSRVISAPSYRKNFIAASLNKMNISEYADIITGSIDDYSRIINSGKFDNKKLLANAEKTLEEKSYVTINSDGSVSDMPEYEYKMEIMHFRHLLEGGDIVETIEKMIMGNLGQTEKIKFCASKLYDIGKKHWAEIFLFDNNSIYNSKININAIVEHEDKLNVIDILKIFNFYNFKREMAMAFQNSQSVLKNLQVESYIPKSHIDNAGSHTDYEENAYTSTEHEDYWDWNTNPKRGMHYDSNEDYSHHTDIHESHEDRIVGDRYVDVDIDEFIKLDF
ncbi:MAG: hypothetical protein AB1Z23_13195 [Eubacteriales bacterium]